MAAPASDYVQANIDPSLKPALAALCAARPKEPVKWLGEYLLANKPSGPTQPPPLVPTEGLPSAASIIAQIHGGSKTCVEVVSEKLARLDQVEPTLNAFVEVMREAALTSARAVDAKIAKGLPLRRLEGLPIVVKTNIDLSGTLTTAATPALAEWRPRLNAPCVEPLLAEGAIVLGKTTMPEMAIGFRGQSALHGQTMNPFNVEHIPGGSSTGTAVAIAAGIVPCGLGSDTAGSLRVPAAHCGGVGLRPSIGPDRVWSATGVVPCSVMRDTPGPMGGCVSDVALLDAVVRGEPAVALPASLLGVRIGIAEDWIAEAPPLAPETRKGIDLAAAALASAGATVGAVAGLAEVKQLASATWEPPLPVPIEDSGAALQAYLDRHASNLPDNLKTVADVAEKFGNGSPIAGILKHYYALEPKGLSQEGFDAKMVAREEGIAATEAAYAAFFARTGLSVVLMPVYPAEPTRCDAPPINTFTHEGAFAPHLCTIGNAPQLVLPTPSKFAASGIPTSVMLLGVDDKIVLSIGLALEQALKEM